jgi:hypothetical protein
VPWPAGRDPGRRGRAGSGGSKQWLLRRGRQGK